MDLKFIISHERQTKQQKKNTNESKCNTQLNFIVQMQLNMHMPGKQNKYSELFCAA